MKSLNEIKSKKSMWLMSLAVAIAATGFVFALDAPEEPYARSEFKKENLDIRKDMNSVTTSQARIEVLQAKLKNDKKAKDQMAVNAGRKNLAKAKADRKREKAYLCADKQDLKADHAYSIGQTRAEVKQDKRELAKAKCQLKKDLRKNNTAALHGDVDKILGTKRELKADQAALDRKTEARDTELAAVNAELVSAGLRNEFVDFDKQGKTAQAKAKTDNEKATASADTRKSQAQWME